MIFSNQQRTRRAMTRRQMNCFLQQCQEELFERTSHRGLPDETSCAGRKSVARSLNCRQEERSPQSQLPGTLGGGGITGPSAFKEHNEVNKVKSVKTLRTQLLGIGIIALIAMVTGCAEDWKAHVESDTAWYGTFGNHTAEGTGDKEVDIPDRSGTCVTVQKLTNGGTLSIELQGHDGFILSPDRKNERVKTTARQGSVYDCVP